MVKNNEFFLLGKNDDVPEYIHKYRIGSILDDASEVRQEKLISGSSYQRWAILL
jgi:hypothetical protein